MLYLGKNQELRTYGLFQNDLFVIHRLTDMDNFKAKIDGNWVNAWFRNNGYKCWLEDVDTKEIVANEDVMEVIEVKFK